MTVLLPGSGSKFATGAPIFTQRARSSQSVSLRLGAHVDPHGVEKLHHPATFHRVAWAYLPLEPIRATREHPVIDIDPNGTGLPGIDQLRIIVGAVMTVGLILSVLALLVSAIVWGFGANSSNPHLASRGKLGVLVACGAAIICGGAVTLINFFWNVGQAV